MTTRFLNPESLWPTIRAADEAYHPKHVAVAYVTDRDALTWRSGDVLVCDASDQAIAAGSTSAATLRALFEMGVLIYSVDVLHAKTYVIGPLVIIGSPNLSGLSQQRLLEAGIFSDDTKVVADAREFVLNLKATARFVDDVFLCRIESIPTRQPEALTAAPAEVEITQPTLYRLKVAPHQPPQTLRAYFLALIRVQLGGEFLPNRPFRLWHGPGKAETFPEHCEKGRLNRHGSDIYSLTEQGVAYFEIRKPRESLVAEFLKAITTGREGALPVEITKREMEPLEPVL